MNINTPANQPTPNWRKTILLSGGMILLCCFGTLCYFGLLFYVVDQDISLIPSPTLNPNCEETACLNACIRRLPDFANIHLSAYKDELDKVEGGFILASYWIRPIDGQLEQPSKFEVPDYLKAYQDDIQLHTYIWNYFNKIFPTNDKINLSYITFYMDTNDRRFAASVSKSANGKWNMYVNLIEFDTAQDTTKILVHEYGHIVTLNDKEVEEISVGYDGDINRKEFEIKRAECGDNFFTGYKCADSNSYLNLFGNRFWNGQLYKDWITVFLQSDDVESVYHSAIDRFYLKYPDQFVTSYAATNPHEDIAESWTEFIMRPKPVGDTIADQKVLFFYEYPELVQARNDILQAVCQFAIDQK